MELNIFQPMIISASLHTIIFSASHTLLTNDDSLYILMKHHEIQGNKRADTY